MQKNPRESLQKEKNILQEVMNGTKNVHLVYLDKNFNFLLVNETYATTCGYKPEEMIGKNHFALYPNDENESIFKRVRDTGVSAEFHDKPFVFPDQPKRGVTYWDWTLKPVRSESVETDGLVFSLVETTKRKKTEEALRESEERLKMAQQVAHVGTFEWNIQTGVNIWTPELESLYGLPPGGFRGTQEAWEQLVYPEDRPNAKKSVSEALEKGTFESEWRVVWPDGSVHWIYGRALGFKDANGKPLRLIGINIDITERKKAEEELRKSEQRYRSYIEITGEIGWTTNDRGEVVEDLPSIRNYTGLTFEEIKGSLWSKALHPDDLEHTLSVWRRAVNEKREYEVEYRLRRHDGVYRYFLARGVPVFHKDGTVREWVGTCIDITDRKTAEDYLREQSMIIDLAPDAIFSTDSSFVIKSWNKAAERIFGWEAGEVIGKASTSIFGIVYPKLNSMTREQVNEELMNRGFWHGEVIYHRKDNSSIPVSVSVRLLKDNNGVFNGTIAVIHDITRRKNRERVLRQAKNDLNRAQAVAKTGSWRLDVQHDVLLWSDENHRIFGVPKGTPMTYSTFLNIVHPDDRELVDSKWNAALKGDDYDIEHRIIVDGKIKWVREKVELEFDNKGILKGGFGTTQEITDLVEMREKLERYNRELEKLVEEKTAELKHSERMAAIGATAGMVGHDIRNPLQAITSDAYLLRSGVSSFPESEQKRSMIESLDYIDLNVEYIDKIVQDLQDYSRDIRPLFREIDLEDLCEKILFKNHQHDGIFVTCEVDRKIRKIVSDPDVLRRILFNLISNAFQAMIKGGRLDLKACQDGDDLVLVVQDTGEGIPEEVRSKLFTPLFTTKSKGQGFGLAVVKRMANALGGSITYESELGKGTTFLVRLPLPHKSN